MTHAVVLADFLALADLGRTLGPGAGATVSETFGIYRREAVLTPGQLGGITLAGCLTLYTAFAGALDLRLSGQFGHVAIQREQLSTSYDGAGGPVALPLAEGADDPAVAAAIAAALAEMAGDEATLVLTIDKIRLATAIARERGWADGAHVAYFFALGALVALLDDEGLSTLDSLFFVAAARPTVIVVGETDALLYRGELLSIVGEGRQSPPARIEEFVRLPVDAAALQKYRDVGRDRLAFDFVFARLTPAHLICVAEEGGSPALTNALRRALFHASVLYTANRAHKEGVNGAGETGARRYLASYHERRRTAHLALCGDDRVGLDDAVLADFARWPYGGEGRSNDRLDMLQRTFAQALPGDAAENTRALLDALSALLAEAKAQYGVFIDEQLDEYAKQRQGIADYAADVAKKVADGVETLTKGLTDTALITMAAVAAVVVAAVTNDNLRGRAFTLTLVVYATYLTLQALYRMLSVGDSMRLLRAETDQRLATIAAQLGERALQPLRGLLARRWAQFWRWAAITVVAYGLMALFVLGVGILGPRTDLLRASSAPAPGVTSTAGTPGPTTAPPLSTGTAETVTR